MNSEKIKHNILTYRKYINDYVSLAIVTELTLYKYNILYLVTHSNYTGLNLTEGGRIYI